MQNSEFGNIMKAAAHIKSTQMVQDKRKFDALPDYSKTGLYCGEMFINVRKQNYNLKKIAYEKGFKFVASGPLVRSSYKAADYLKHLRDQGHQL